MIYIRRFFTGIVFIAGLICLLLIASSVFEPKNNMENFGMEEVTANGILGEKDNSIDVLVLGDSEAYSSIIPLQLWQDTGYTMYVCGSSAQTLGYTDTLLKRCFNNQSPKIVILETNAIYRKQSALNIFASRICEKFSIFKYHNRWKSLSFNDFYKEVEYTWTDENKGYRLSKTIAAASDTDYMNLTDKEAVIPSANLFCIQTMKDFCDANGAKLVFVSTPSTKNWNMERHNGIAALALKLGCEYIDLNLMNDEISIDWSTDTRDKGDHLNYFGAKKVTAYLSEYLMKTELLTDKTHLPEYKSWNEALERFKKAEKN